MIGLYPKESIKILCWREEKPKTRQCDFFLYQQVAAMRKEFFSHTWLLFELGITLVGILDIILIETDSISYNFDLTETVVFMNVIRLLRILRILKVRSKGRTHDFRFHHLLGVRECQLKPAQQVQGKTFFWLADV